MWDLSFSYWHLPTLIVEVAGSSRHQYLSAEVMQGSDIFLAELLNCVVRCIWHGLVTARLILERNGSIIPILKTFTLLQIHRLLQDIAGFHHQPIRTAGTVNDAGHTKPRISALLYLSSPWKEDGSQFLNLIVLFNIIYIYSVLC